MKTCGACQVSKNLEEFGKNKARADGLQTQCKQCRKFTNSRYYRNTPERNVQRKAWLVSRQLLLKAWLYGYLLEHTCVDCGESDIVVLEFDHVRGTKIASITQMVQDGVGLDTLQDEVLKCEVRCANDHRRVTAQRAGYWKLAPEALR